MKKGRAALRISCCSPFESRQGCMNQSGLQEEVGGSLKEILSKSTE